MTRLERNRRQAAAIVARIEQNMEISRLCRAGQLIKTANLANKNCRL